MAPEGRKVGSLKRRVRSQLARGEMKNARRCGAKRISGPLLAVEMSKKCTPLWREAHFEVKMYKTLHVRATFGSSDVEKVVRTWCVFVHVHFEMCFAPQRRQFFDISTSKSGLTMVCIVHFDFEMCFAPQRRALFRHLNFQKWSENCVFCTF